MAGRKPIERRGLETRLVDAVFAMTREGGLASLAARPLAQRAGCSVGTLYNVYGSLDGLILAASARALSELAAMMEKEADHVEEGPPTLYRLTASYMAFARAEPEIWRLALEPPVPPDRPRPPALRQAIETLERLGVKGFGPSLSGALDDDARLDECRRRSHLLWAAAHGVATLAVADTLAIVTDRSAETMAREITALFADGFG